MPAEETEPKGRTRTGRLDLPGVSDVPRGKLLRGKEVSLLYEDRRSPAVVPEHRHRQLQVGLLFEPSKGVLSWRPAAGGAREQAVEGPQLCLIAPNVMHACRWAGPNELLVLYVEEVFWRRHIKRKLAGVVLTKQGSAAGNDLILWQLGSTLVQLRHEREKADPRMAEIVAGALALRAFKLLFGAAPYRGNSGGVLSPNRLRLVDDHIRRELSRDIHVVDLAKRVALSVPHFTVVFKNTTGLAPYEYITRCRMLKAQELLKTGEYRLGEVARAVGYEDQGHFSWRFHQFFRFAPRLLLKHARGQSFKTPKKSLKRP